MVVQRRRLRLTPLVALLLASSASAQYAEEPVSPEEGTAEPVETRTLDHSLWDSVLVAHVNERGEVDYQALLDSPGDLQRLDDYLLWLQTANLFRTSDAERVAFWVNAYNAIAVRAALDAYPVESVLNVPGFFIRERQVVAGTSLSLNEIENDQLRHMLGEARVHFALSTMSRGSPPLRREAYAGATLDAQLEDQARRYVTATTTVRPNVMEIELSPLFEWFAHDFDPLGGVRTFVAAHVPEEVAGDLRNESLLFVFADWDWRLNDATER